MAGDPKLLYSQALRCLKRRSGSTASVGVELGKNRALVSLVKAYHCGHLHTHAVSFTRSSQISLV